MCEDKKFKYEEEIQPIVELLESKGFIELSPVVYGKILWIFGDFTKFFTGTVTLVPEIANGSIRDVTST
jgi:hypothetical protein